MRLSELTERLGGRLQGDRQVEIDGVASLSEAGPSEVSFLSHERYVSQMAPCQAAAVLVPTDFSGSAPMSLVFVGDVSDALDQTLACFASAPDVPEAGVHASAVVSAGTHLADGVAVGPQVVIGNGARIGAGSILSAGCVIGRGVEIGEDCRLEANVVIQQRCRLGNRVIIHPNSTIGSDGFGYRFVEGRHQKIAHIGVVVIEDDVEIGANTCVDRAKFSQTVIGRGTKIDNLVQVGHNVRVGEHGIIVALSGIGGSARLGKYVVLGGQCAVAEHVELGDGVMAGARSGISKDVEAGKKVFGFPAREFRQYVREVALVKKIPALLEALKALRGQVEKGAGTKDPQP